jgi:perosamine synthetase
MVLTDDDALCARLRQLKDQGRPARGTGGDDLHPVIGYNFKLTNLQAAIGLAQLECIEARAARMREIYGLYREGLRDVEGLMLPGFAVDEGETPQWIDAVTADRDELDRFLALRGMACRRFWFPLHTQAPYRRPDAGFPHSSRICRQALWLPSAFTLSDADVLQVCEAIGEFFGGNGRISKNHGVSARNHLC